MVMLKRIGYIEENPETMWLILSKDIQVRRKRGGGSGWAKATHFKMQLHEARRPQGLLGFPLNRMYVCGVVDVCAPEYYSGVKVEGATALKQGGLVPDGALGGAHVVQLL